jgi:type II secretory pathway pseudopilin PulG
MTITMPQTSRTRTLPVSRPAFVLFEIMIALVLFTVFAVVAVRLVSTILHIANGASQAESTHRSFDAALAHLRQDVWSTTAIEVTGAGGVTLTRSGDAGSVTWNPAADGSLVRTSAPTGDDPVREVWRGAGEGVSLRQDAGGVLLLDVPKGRGHDNGSYRFYSQVLLAREQK